MEWSRRASVSCGHADTGAIPFARRQKCCARQAKRPTPCLNLVRAADLEFIGQTRENTAPASQATAKLGSWSGDLVPYISGNSDRVCPSQSCGAPWRGHVLSRNIQNLADVSSTPEPFTLNSLSWRERGCASLRVHLGSCSLLFNWSLSSVGLVACLSLWIIRTSTFFLDTEDILPRFLATVGWSCPTNTSHSFLALVMFIFICRSL